MPVPEERKRDIEESWFMIKFRFETNPNKVLLTPSNQQPNVCSAIWDWPNQLESTEMVQVIVGAVADATSSFDISPETNQPWAPYKKLPRSTFDIGMAFPLQFEIS